MILPAIIAFGLAAAAATLALARMELVLTQSTGAVAGPFGDAAASIMAWIALAALVVSGLIAIGIPPTILLATATLLLGRLTPASPLFTRLFPLKLPLGLIAMLTAIAALIGTLSLIQGVSHG